MTRQATFQSVRIAIWIAWVMMAMPLIAAPSRFAMYGLILLSDAELSLYVLLVASLFPVFLLFEVYWYRRQQRWKLMNRL